MIFMGSGSTARDLVVLYDHFHAALMTLSGLQQPGHPSNREEYLTEQRSRLEMKSELRDHLKRIAEAFGCRMVIPKNVWGD